MPQLLAPANNTWQPTAGPLFEWSEVPGAATYFLEVRVLGSTANYTTATTAATAYAPIKAIATGDYTWRVTARDAAGNSLGTSATRSFRVDATPPTIKKIKPTSKKLKAAVAGDGGLQREGQGRYQEVALHHARGQEEAYEGQGQAQ